MYSDAERAGRCKEDPVHDGTNSGKYTGKGRRIEGDEVSGLQRRYCKGVQTVTGLPKSNVLYFELENEAWCCIRPSGTEPKIKFYIGVKGTSDADAAEKRKVLTKAVESLAE